MRSSYQIREGQSPLASGSTAEARGLGAGGSRGSEPAPPTPVLRKPLLTLPGTGLLDQVLSLRLVGHLKEAVLAALGQHLLHGSWGDMGTGAEDGVAARGAASQGPPSHPLKVTHKRNLSD